MAPPGAPSHFFMAENTQESPRIASLRHRLAAEPDSRVFYQLGEELRKAGRLDEAAEVLKKGLESHGGYLSAWVSLGRTLLENRKFDDAVSVLEQGLGLDPQNIVTARLLADAHYERRDPVESIKKYKLVRALLPTDEVVAERIDQLEKIIAGALSFEDPGNETESEIAEEAPEPEASVPDPSEDPTREVEPEPEPEPEQDPESQPAEVKSPEPVETAETAQDLVEEKGPEDSVAPTVTMGDLYLEQGHTEQAREIYERVLNEEPENQEAAQRLSSLPEDGEYEPDGKSGAEQKIEVLEKWLSRVSRG